MLELPATVLDAIGDNASSSAEHGGLSGSLWRVDSATGTFYVRQGSAAELEHRAIQWIGGRIPTAQVVAFVNATLLLADANADPVSSMQPVAAGTAMGSLLRALHRPPANDCLFDAPTDTLVEQARLGVGDRHRDLALAGRDLGAQGFAALLAAYEPRFSIHHDRMAWS